MAAYLLYTVVGLVAYYMSRPGRRPQQDVDAIQPFLHSRRNIRHNSLDSGYTSHYGTTSNFNIQRDCSNDERFCQLCTLKEQESAEERVYEIGSTSKRGLQEPLRRVTILVRP